MSIKVKRIVEINVEMTLTQNEADQLMHFLKTACTAPTPSVSGVPYTDIVRRLADALDCKKLY